VSEWRLSARRPDCERPCRWTIADGAITTRTDLNQRESVAVYKFSDFNNSVTKDHTFNVPSRDVELRERRGTAVCCSLNVVPSL
jgi:hypothetical protein